MEGSTEYQEWAGAILAGGRARRFHGRDKGSLIINGRPIIARQLETLAPVTSRRFIVANDASRYATCGVTIVPDAIPGLGPLGGIYTALQAATTPALLVLACDMPFLTCEFLEYLEGRLGSADAVVPRSADGRHVLCAALSTRLVDAARAALAARRYAIADFLRDLDVVDVSPAEVAVFDPQEQLLTNVNTEADYRRLVDASPSPASVWSRPRPGPTQ